MSPSLVYVDESGNSGDVAGQPGAIATQPSFVLAGIVEGDQTGAAEELVSQLRADYGFQAKDLKWKSVAKKPRAIVHLVRELRRRNVVPFVEVMSKRHYLASNIMTYVLGRRRIDFTDDGQFALANACADFLAADVGHAALIAYAVLSKAPTPEQFETFLLLLRTGVHDALEERWLSPDRIQIATFVDDILDDVVNEWHTARTRANLDRFVQEPDTSLGGHRLGLLLQVQALCNLLARINAHHEPRSEVRLIHDQQSEFGPVIREYFELLTANKHEAQLTAHTTNAQAPVSWDFQRSKFTLAFDDSATSAGIQIADVLAGFCRSKLDAALLGEPSDELLDTAARQLGEMSPQAGPLLVATRHQVQMFFGSGSSRR
jgi:hypothetical protein